MSMGLGPAVEGMLLARKEFLKQERLMENARGNNRNESSGARLARESRLDMADFEVDSMLKVAQRITGALEAKAAGRDSAEIDACKALKLSGTDLLSQGSAKPTPGSASDFHSGLTLGFGYASGNSIVNSSHPTTLAAGDQPMPSLAADRLSASHGERVQDGSAGTSREEQLQLSSGGPHTSGTTSGAAGFAVPSLR